MIDIARAHRQFDAYLDQFDRANEKIKLKIIHTDGVVDCAREIARRSDFREEDCQLAELIALLHDIGRFEQVTRYDSFEPAVMDHAAYGVQLLFDRSGGEPMIRQFVESDRWDDIIYTAIARHSDFVLDGIGDERTLLHARLIRDADKLDNCRVKLEDSIEVLLGTDARTVGEMPITDAVLAYPRKQMSVRSADRVTKMDYWVSYVAYFFDINFKATFDIIREKRYVERIIGRIPCSNPDTAEKMRELESLVTDFIDSRRSS